MRGMEITPIKVGTKDIDGARKFSLKAQKIYPFLEGMT